MTDQLSPENEKIIQEEIAKMRAAVTGMTMERATEINAKIKGLGEAATETEKIKLLISGIAEIGIENIGAAYFLGKCQDIETKENQPGLALKLRDAFLAQPRGEYEFWRGGIPYRLINEEKANQARAAAAQKQAIRVEKLAKQGKVLCDRCGGAGGWKGWPGFTCYRCNGTGIDPHNKPIQEK